MSTLKVIGTVETPKPTTKLTKAQKLSRALKACHKLPKRTRAQKHKRAACETKARKLYGAHKASAKKSSRRAK